MMVYETFLSLRAPGSFDAGGVVVSGAFSGQVRRLKTIEFVDTSGIAPTTVFLQRLESGGNSGLAVWESILQRKTSGVQDMGFRTTYDQEMILDAGQELRARCGTSGAVTANAHVFIEE